MKTIEQVLIERDGLSAEEAKSQVEKAKEDLCDRLANDEMPFDICYDWFGLEPDYLDELI